MVSVLLFSISDASASVVSYYLCHIVTNIERSYYRSPAKWGRLSSCQSMPSVCCLVSVAFGVEQVVIKADKLD